MNCNKLLVLIVLLQLLVFGNAESKSKKKKSPGPKLANEPLTPDDYEFGKIVAKQNEKKEEEKEKEKEEKGKTLRNIENHEDEQENSSLKNLRSENLLSLSNASNVNNNGDDDINRPEKPQKKESHEWKRKWPNGTVPYMLGDGFNKSERGIIAYTFHEFAKLTCVRFAVRTNEPSFILITKSKSICGGVVGRNSGGQFVTIAPFCMKTVGLIEHELMHALGFFHEQSRIDRDKFVKVLYQNMRKGFPSQYAKIKSTKYSNLLTTYDYLSVTQYYNNAGSKNGKPTMERLDNKTGKLGQRTNLTNLDIKKIENLYECKGTTNEYVNSKKAPDFSSCKDVDPKRCGKDWKELKYCESKENLMFLYCRKTCGLCDKKKSCMDLEEMKCGTWKEKSYCSEFKDYMSVYCAKTCQFC